MSTAENLRVEILAFEGCPNAALARDRVTMALEAEHLAAQIKRVDVPNAELAQQMRFLGSPSVRVNGEDVEATRETCDYGLMCRTYLTDGRLDGAPSVDLIRAAIRRARHA